MNMLPTIDKSRRGFRFSNPLSGVIYNNNQYLQQCHYDPDPQATTSIMTRKAFNSNLPKAFGTNSSMSQKKPNFNKLDQSHHRLKHSNKFNDSKNNYSMVHTSVSQVQNQIPKMQKTIYKFPDIEVKIIDQIASYKDFIQKNLRVNLSHYFGMFFKKTLAGPLTVDLIDIVQKYLQILTSKGSLDSSVEMKDYPSEYFSLKSKRAFVQRIQELQIKKNFKPIQQMIKYYCVPTRQFRQSCFRDILHMITQSLYQKFNLTKDKEYVLLDQNGHLVEDVCSIKFSTSQLLITVRSHFQRSYNQYKSILESNLQNFKKMSFSQQLKKNFRGKIAAGKFDDSKVIDQKQIIQANQRRRFAQSKLQSHRSPDKSLQKYNPSKTANGFNSKSKSRQKLNYDRKSKSTLSQHKSLNSLSSTKIRTMSARKRNQAYMQIFEKLYLMNNIHDITFNHQNQKKLLMVVFKKQFPLFKNKTIPQINAILKAFKIDPQSQIVSLQDFCKINQVSNCKGQNQNIVQFVSRYLPFNQYGEMDKQSLAKTLNFILNDLKGQQVVLQIIWSWLQKSKLIENNVLIRNTLESWYEKNKMAFAIIVSLVFGTNQTTWIDMAYQILI